MMILCDLDFPIDEENDLGKELAADAAQAQAEEQQARDEGFCIHCGESLEDCTGYKCWIR